MLSQALGFQCKALRLRNCKSWSAMCERNEGHHGWKNTCLSNCGSAACRCGRKIHHTRPACAYTNKMSAQRSALLTCPCWINLGGQHARFFFVCFFDHIMLLIWETSKAISEGKPVRRILRNTMAATMNSWVAGISVKNYEWIIWEDTMATSTLPRDCLIFALRDTNNHLIRKLARYSYSKTHRKCWCNIPLGVGTEGLMRERGQKRPRRRQVCEKG